MKNPSVSLLLKPLALIVLLASASCSVVKPVKKKEVVPASDVPVSAETRQQALALISKELDKETRTRYFAGGANDGWIEEIKFVKLEEVKTENIKGGKRRIIVRETRQVSRWKVYNGAKKGGPTVRMDTSVQNFIF